MKNFLIINMLLALSACVTINIYFPAAEAQKAADKIIDEVWQLENGKKAPDEKAPSEKSTEISPAENKPAEVK